MKSWSIAKMLGIVDKRQGFDWSILLVICAATMVVQLLMEDGCREEMLDPQKKISQKCQSRLIPAMIIMLVLTILQFQRLVGKCN